MSGFSPRDSAIAISSSSSEEQPEASSSARPQAAPAESLQAAAPEQSTPASAPIDNANRQKRKGSDMLWGGLDGHGPCIGSNQLPCCFGCNGHPANAGPDGRCDLCSGDALRALHEHMPQRVTHLLVALQGKPLQHALIRVKIIFGEAAMNDYDNRRQRALHRRDPNRPSRGPRAR